MDCCKYNINHNYKINLNCVWKDFKQNRECLMWVRGKMKIHTMLYKSKAILKRLLHVNLIALVHVYYTNTTIEGKYDNRDLILVLSHTAAGLSIRRTVNRFYNGSYSRSGITLMFTLISITKTRLSPGLVQD